jgi:hypothetical protein
MSITISDNKIIFSKGIIAPSVKCNEGLTIPTTISSPEELGSVYFNTNSNLLSVFNGASWVSTPGPTGSNGQNGQNGVTGPAGQDGLTGPAGQNGQNGQNGVTGSNGVTGPAGQDGSQGTGGPAFSAYASGQQTSIGNSIITFNREEFDTSSTYDTSSSRWTPGVAGYYQINSLVTCVYASGGIGDIYIYLRKNSSVYKSSTRYSYTDSFIQPSISTIIYLSATDYIDIYCLTSTTFNTNPTFGPSTNQMLVYFNGCFLKNA